MTYTQFPLSMVGGTERVYSDRQNNELAQNYFVYMSEKKPAIQGFCGSTAHTTSLTQGECRGSTVFNGILYVVTGTNLEKIEEDGTRATVGVINGTTQCIFANDGSELFITAGGTVYSTQGTSVTEQTSSTYESPNSVAFLNSRYIYDMDADKYGVSPLLDGSSIESFAFAQSDPDDLVRPYTYGQKLYLMGQKTIEPHYDAGTGSPPFERIDTAIIQKGLGALYSVSQTDSAMYFLGDDLNVYQLAGNGIRSISTAGIAKEMQTGWTDAVGFCFNLERQDFYFITSKTANKTFLYSESANVWTSLTYTAANDQHIAGSYQFVYGKHIIVDRRNGDTLEWDLDVNTDNGAVIQRRRIVGPINGGDLGAPGQRLQMSRIELFMQKGVGLASGQGSNPIIIVDVSLDGGESWKQIENVRFGRAGDFLTKAEAYYLGSFYDLNIRVTQTDPVFSNITGGVVDLQLAGY